MYANRTDHAPSWWLWPFIKQFSSHVTCDERALGSRHNYHPEHKPRHYFHLNVYFQIENGNLSQSDRICHKWTDISCIANNGCLAVSICHMVRIYLRSLERNCNWKNYWATCLLCLWSTAIDLFTFPPIYLGLSSAFQDGSKPMCPLISQKHF
jgi:hypothetical protein